MKIALIGRPNVGKSSLFNRLVGQRLAIVNEEPGVTRDRREGYAIGATVIDTPGVAPGAKSDLESSMNEQSFLAVKESDLVFFVIESVNGVTEYDREIARWLRNVYKKIGNKNTIVVVNKSENLKYEIYTEELGFKKAVYVSAEHNFNVQELYEIISQYCEEESEEDAFHDVIKIAIAGRPNVGKSTLVNAIIGENRVVTGEIAGITRDSIEVPFNFKGSKFKIIDTAGQRRKSRVQEHLEHVSVLDSWRYIKQAHAVIMVVDATIPLEKQDLLIAKKVEEEGKILVFAINKIDEIVDAKSLIGHLQKRLEKEFAQIPGVHCIGISAKKGENINALLSSVVKLYDGWNSRIKTGDLNKFLEEAISNYSPPMVNGFPIKLKYITQTSVRPPTFTLFANRGNELPESYKRYLVNRLRSVFKMDGMPLRLNIRQRKNPYAK